MLPAGLSKLPEECILLLSDSPLFHGLSADIFTAGVTASALTGTGASGRYSGRITAPTHSYIMP